MDKKVEKITGKQVRIGKGGSEYLCLWTNSKKIIVFASDIPKKDWDEIEVGKTYELVLKLGKGGVYILKDFQTAITFSWPPNPLERKDVIAESEIKKNSKII